MFIADYVLPGYGTGAIMAVPGQDERDWAFAEAFDLPIVRTVQPPEGWDGQAYTGDGPAINSGFLDGLGIDDAKRRIAEWLVEHGAGEPTVIYKLRDWLFSRQRYWGEPFPIVYDDDGLPRALPPTALPVELPEVDDFRPGDASTRTTPTPNRRRRWREPNDGSRSRSISVTARSATGARPTSCRSGPVPAGTTCAIWTRRTTTHSSRPRSSATGWSRAASISTSAAPSTPSSTSCTPRFWHKVLYDLGHVSTPEPFHRLFNQGYIQAPAFRDERGMIVDAAAYVEERDGQFLFEDEPVAREFGKMGKSLKNVVTPDEIYRDFGADTLRLYEMFMGPLDASRPWSTTDIIGMHRFLQRVWRNLVDENTGETRVGDAAPGRRHPQVAAPHDRLGARPTWPS